MSKRAQEIIKLEERERGNQSNFRTLWQDTADLIYPTENQIVNKTLPGENKTDRIYDPTSMMEAENMASGLAQNLVPPGQKFFALKAADRALQEIEAAKRHLSKVTEVTHDELFASNFMLQLTETLQSDLVFGTCNLYSEYATELNFRDYAIGTYQILENAKRRVDGTIQKFILTASQAMEEFDGNPGDAVVKAANNPDDAQKKFEFIHVVRPRKKRNLNFSDNMNMPFESLYVSVKDVEVIDEGGFDEFPYHVARWKRASGEKYGRGRGTMALSQTRVLEQQWCDFIECGNKWNNPPREVLSSFEGEVVVTPGANNFVEELGSIKAIDEGIRGNFPITKDIIEMQRQIIKDAFFSSAFAPLTDLTGDRRNMLEIRQRVLEAFKKMSSPIGRIQTELFTPLISRVVKLLERNGKLPPAPPELQGREFKIEYIGPLSLALKSSEVEASQQWISIVGEIEAISPGAVDNVDFDDAIRRMARSFGVNEEDIASQEEVEEKRAARQQAQEQQQAMEMAQIAGQAYPGTTKAPEEGSPAEALMGAG